MYLRKTLMTSSDVAKYLLLYIAQRLLGKVAWLADISVIVDRFQMLEITTFSQPLTYNGDGWTLDVSFLYFSCHTSSSYMITLGNAPNCPFIYAR